MPPFANLFRARRRFSHISPPKDGRKMKNVAESPTYVTREELDALTRVFGIALARVHLAHSRTGYADGNIATQLEIAERYPSLPTPERAAFKSIIKAFEQAMEQHHAAERRRAADAAVSAKAFNF